MDGTMLKMVMTARSDLAATRRLHAAKMMLHFVRKYLGITKLIRFDVSIQRWKCYDAVSYVFYEMNFFVCLYHCACDCLMFYETVTMSLPCEMFNIF